MFIGVILFVIGNILAWFQYNSQFAWEWWQGRPIFSKVVFAFPMGLCFWYAIKHIVDATGELWASKLVGFGVSNVVFGIMTYWILNESVFTPKTASCLLLAVMIIFIQIYWK